jgi:hypothetical protein
MGHYHILIKDALLEREAIPSRHRDLLKGDSSELNLGPSVAI